MFPAPGSRAPSRGRVPCNCYVSCSETYVSRYQTCPWNGPVASPILPLPLLLSQSVPGTCSASQMLLPTDPDTWILLQDHVVDRRPRNDRFPRNVQCNVPDYRATSSTGDLVTIDSTYQSG